MKLHKTNPVLVVLCCLAWGIGITGCGSGEDPNSNSAQSSEPRADGLSAFEVENGIGPIKAKLEIGPIDEALVTEGKSHFEIKCAACHKFDERYVGPPLRDVAQRRTGEYVINMILNPEENYQRHPEAKKLLAEYLTFMANQNVAVEEARAILEYLRQVSTEAPDS